MLPSLLGECVFLAISIAGSPFSLSHANVVARSLAPRRSLLPLPSLSGERGPLSALSGDCGAPSLSVRRARLPLFLGLTRDWLPHPSLSRECVHPPSLFLWRMCPPLCSFSREGGARFPFVSGERGSPFHLYETNVHPHSLSVRRTWLPVSSLSGECASPPPLSPASAAPLSVTIRWMWLPRPCLRRASLPLHLSLRRSLPSLPMSLARRSLPYSCF